MNTYTLQFLYLLFLIGVAGYYLFLSYKIKVRLIKFIEFYNSYLKTVINIKIEGDYFNGKERLWHGKDSVEEVDRDDLVFLFTRSPMSLLRNKEKVQVISYFYFSDEFKILGELETKISPVVNSFLEDKGLEDILKKYRKNKGSFIGRTIQNFK